MTNNDSFFKKLEKISPDDRLKMYEIASALEEGQDTYTMRDYLVMYLDGVRDWKQDYAKFKK